MVPGARRIPELDGLRGAAVGLVIAFHVVLSVPTGIRWLDGFMLFGWSGVDMFFVLSGFLIGGILLDNRDSGSYFSTFYARRFFRIVPAYFAVLAGYGFCWVIGGEVRSELVNHAGPPMSMAAYVTFTNNFWIALHDSMKIFLSPSWSLSIEEQFYLSLPLLIYMLRRKDIWKMVTAGIVVVVAARWICCANGFVTQNQAYVLPWFRTDGLLIGVGVALIARSERASAWFQRHTRFLWIACAAFATVLLISGTLLPADNAKPSAPIMTYGLTCVSLLYASMLMLALFSGGGWFSSVLKVRPLRWLGKVSYCLYLIHVPIFATSFNYFGARPAVLIAALCIMGLLAELSWRFFEGPLMRIGHRFHYAPPIVEDGPALLAEAPSTTN